MQWRPEFDVTLAYNPRSVLVPVAHIEGLTWTVLSPGSTEGGSLLAGPGRGRDARRSPRCRDRRQSLAVRCDLGGDATRASAGSRAGQYMLLDQAVREARIATARTSTLLHPAAVAKCSRAICRADASCSMSIAPPTSSGARVLEALWDQARHRGRRRSVGRRRRVGRAKVPVLLDPLDESAELVRSHRCAARQRGTTARAGVSVGFTQFGRRVTTPQDSTDRRQRGRARLAVGCRAGGADRACPQKFSALRARAGASRSARSPTWCCGAAIRSK